jgi:uncharacterized protein (TIGR03067 family)
MNRLVALLLALGILACAVPLRADKDDEKKEEKKKDKKDDKKADKTDEKKDKPKAEEKLTDEQKEELKKLSGTFTVEVLEEDGKKRPAEELKKMKVVQKGAEWTFHLGEELTQGKDTPYPNKSPKEIDSLYTNAPPAQRDKTVKGIYEIEGDTIKYCWADVGKERPKEFATKADSGLTLLVLKRVKEASPGEKDKEKDKDKEKTKEKDKEKEKTKEKDKEKDKDKKEEKKDDK